MSVSALALLAWFSIIALAPSLLGRDTSMSDRSLVSALVGAIFLGMGFAIDGPARREWAGSIYIAGLAATVAAFAIAGGRIPTEPSDGNTGWLTMAGLIGAAFLLVGLALHRRSFAVFAAILLSGAAGHVADDKLVDEAFPFVLVGVGVALVAGTFAWRRAEALLGRALDAHMPARLAQVLASRRRQATAS